MRSAANPLEVRTFSWTFGRAFFRGTWCAVLRASGHWICWVSDAVYLFSKPFTDARQL